MQIISCNIVIKICHGRYIIFFAGDDLMYPGKINAQVSAMEANLDFSLSYHSVEILDGDNANHLLFITERERKSYFSFLDIISHGGLIGACSVMARLDAIPPGGFSYEFSSVSDWLMEIEIALRGQIIKVDGVYAGHLRHANGASGKTFETLGEIYGTLNYLEKRYGYAREMVLASNRVFNRYLLGELDRLFIAGDQFKLKQLRVEYLLGKIILQALTSVLILLLPMKINHFSLTKKLYFHLSAVVK
jgi:hypothetical protein